MASAEPPSSGAGEPSLAAVLASPPPRQLPPALRRAVLRQSASLSFAIFGLLFGGIGLYFVLIYFPWNFLADLKLRAADTAVVEGRIMAMTKTQFMQKQPGSHTKDNVYQFAFDYQTPDSVLRHGICYTTGRRWIPGDPVPVRYRPNNPEVGCPEDGRLSHTTNGMMLVMLFPIAGFGIVLWVLFTRRRSLHLVTHGLALETLVVDLEHTQTAHDDYPVYKITFQRVDLPRNPPIQLRYWQPKIVAFLQARLASKQSVYLICDPLKPTRCLLPEAL